MQVSTSIEITKPKELVWSAITDIDNTARMISSIIHLEVLERPSSGLVGLKWQETRKMFGKESSEVMWITDYKENEYYATRAESHGSVYVSCLTLSETNGVTTLTMSFEATPQTFVAKLLSAMMNRFIQKSIVDALNKDLLDIKQYVEQNNDTY